MSDRENSEMRDEEDKETDRRTESTPMEETEGRDTDMGTSESGARTDRRHERDPRSSGERRENATQRRHELGQSSGLGLPVRTGVEDCQYYLKTGRCGFGRSCRFNHPPLPQIYQMGDDTVQPGPYPVRPQLPESSQMRHETVQPSLHPDCRQYLQTGQCSYGHKCRFNHPPAPVLPERVNRPICKFFQRGNCKHGSDCKFTHLMSGEGSEPMSQDTNWGKKFHGKRHGAKSSSRPWKRERQAHDLEEQELKKRRGENLRIGPTVQSGEGGIQMEHRLQIPENPNVIAQENLQEQADMERQNREAQEKAEEERRQQIDNARRVARLRLERMRPRVLTSNVDQLRKALPDIGIDRKEGDGF